MTRAEFDKEFEEYCIQEGIQDYFETLVDREMDNDDR